VTGPEHFRAAERLAENYKQALAAVEAMPVDTTLQYEERHFAASRADALLAKAQVHATLALAAATAASQATAYDGDEHGGRSRGWAGVA
jgi:hypothetical protein